MEPSKVTQTAIDTIYSKLKDVYSPEAFETELERIQEDFACLIDRETAALYLAVKEGRIKAEKRSLDTLNDADHVTISGIITRIAPLRTFTRKNGTPGRVQSIYVSDSTREVRVSFWENREIEQIAEGDVITGMKIEVVNGRVTINNYGTTVNVGSYSKVHYTQ